MKKFRKYCQEQTDHFEDECLECYSLSESEDDSSDYSEHESSSSLRPGLRAFKRKNGLF